MELFGKENPHERKPNEKEVALITEVFGAEAIRGITTILADVIQLYPFKSWSRPSAIYEQESFLCIGASGEHDGYFYFLAEDYCIYLFHNYSMFPDLTKRNKEVVDFEQHSGEV